MSKLKNMYIAITATFFALFTGVASAAVDATITDAITAASADALTVITALAVASAALIAGYWLWGAIRRGKGS